MGSSEATISEKNETQSTNKDIPLIVSVAFGEVKTEFSGSPEAVLYSVNSFLAKTIPKLTLAQKLTVNFSLADLVDRFQEFIRITPEGPRVWNTERKYSDKEIVALQLVAQRIAAETGSGSPRSVSLAVLQETTALNPKSLSSRLSELSKSGLVERETAEDGSGTNFRITTLGIDWLSTTLAKKQQQGK